MKIELKCSNCETVLRVDRLHAGKQLRCPTCGTVNSIPLTDDPIRDEDPIEYVSRQPDVEHDQPEPVYAPPEYVGPQSAPLNPPRPAADWSEPQYGPGPNRMPVRGHGDENLGRSYLMFGLGVASFFLCGCLYLFITPTLFSLGISYARRSQDSASSTAFGLNLAGLLIWGLITLAFFSFALIGI